MFEEGAAEVIAASFGEYSNSNPAYVALYGTTVANIPNHFILEEMVKNNDVPSFVSIILKIPRYQVGGAEVERAMAMYQLSFADAMKKFYP